MRYSILLAAGFLQLLAATAAAQTNWPQLRGPQANGHAAASDLPTVWSEQQNIVWKTPIHGQGWSSPVIWGEQIWFCTATPEGHKMYGVCVDKKSGQVVHDLLLFENEEPAFKHAMNSYASCTPAIEEGRVYLHFGSYGTACVDTASGRVLWSRRDLPCDHFRGPGSSPIIYHDKLIIHYDGFDFQYVVALDKSTGATLWKADREIEYGTDDGDIFKAYSTPLVINVGGHDQLISPTSKATVALNPATGEELWRVRYNGFSATAMPVYGDGVLYLSTGFSKAELYAVRIGGEGDVTDTHVAWIEKSIPSKPTPVLVNGMLFMCHDDGVASCLDAGTGAVLWSKRIGGKHSASPLHAAGKIYFFDHEGEATVIEAASEYRELAKNKLDDGCLASPAVSDNALYVRTQTHLYRIEQ